MAGLAVFGILSLTKKHTALANQYKTDERRYNREKRIEDLIKKD